MKLHKLSRITLAIKPLQLLFEKGCLNDPEFMEIIPLLQKEYQLALEVMKYPGYPEKKLAKLLKITPFEVEQIRRYLK